jgi:tRNA A-37 threonylcarbamoyl transferase component Bud32
LRDLSPSEIENVSKTIEHLTLKKEIIAMCAYGSQVASYATKSSDYDVMLVMKPFTQRIKYFYLKGEADCSVLVVDPKALENDCRKSTFGEFVSGRLLNVYSPITGKSYLRENEVAYKKRVIIEGLSEAVANYSQFACEIIFPLRYFLFEKLRKRAAIYPPVVYSYSKTYSDELLGENLEASLEGFKKAAERLQAENVISFDRESDNIRLLPKNFHGGFSAKVEAAASFTSKSLKQYAVHGYAGRVRPDVVGREVMSKISRSRRTGKLPDRIKSPEKEWSIPSGKLFVSSKDWLKDLIEHLGLDEKSCRVSKSSIGEISNAAGIYNLEDNQGKHFSIAVKRFKDVKGMKWGVLNLWSLKNANFIVNPAERLFREYRASHELRRFGLSTPEFIAVFLSQGMGVTKFVRGPDLSKIESAYLDGRSEELDPIFAFGRDLAIMHNRGYCMGDTKPSNAIHCIDDSKIYFVDLEQSHPEGNRTWDLAEFIYYSVRFTLREDRARKLVASFVQGYLSKGSDPRIVQETAALRYRAPFQPFIAPNVLNALKQDLQK